MYALQSKTEKLFKNSDWNYWLRFGNRLASFINKKLPIIEKYEDGKEYKYHHFQVTPMYISEWKGNDFIKRIDYNLYCKNRFKLTKEEYQAL